MMEPNDVMPTQICAFPALSMEPIHLLGRHLSSQMLCPHTCWGQKSDAANTIAYHALVYTGVRHMARFVFHTSRRRLERDRVPGRDATLPSLHSPEPILR